MKPDPPHAAPPGEKLIALMLLACSLIGCDSVVSESRLPGYTDSRSVSCMYSGVCMTMMPGLGFGKSSGYQLKFSPFCSGQRLASVRVVPVEQHRKSGKTTYRESFIVENYKTECSGSLLSMP